MTANKPGACTHAASNILPPLLLQPNFYNKDNDDSDDDEYEHYNLVSMERCSLER